jgi:GntR family transcriptional regulator/MocR family aminotransferase
MDAGLARHEEARLAIVTPSHQFPLGVTMSLRRRLALLAWAQRTGGWIIEDDYDSDFRYAGRPLAALQGLDEAQRVIYVGTLSKILSNAVRVDYLVTPPPARRGRHRVVLLRGVPDPDPRASCPGGLHV